MKTFNAFLNESPAKTKFTLTTFEKDGRLAFRIKGKDTEEIKFQPYDMYIVLPLEK